MAKYLVTGGCGFIGSHLTESLITQGHEVIVIDNLTNGKVTFPQATYITDDIINLEQMQDVFIGCDGCFHLAAIPTVVMELDQWFDIHRVNLMGTLKVFKSALDAGNIPVVFASSCGVYGDSTQLPLGEEDLIKPLSAYGCDKLAAELNAYFLAHTYQLPSIGLRFFNVYGPGQQPDSPYSGVITHFITDIMEDKPLNIYGDGEQTRDFVYIDDIVASLLHAMKILKQGAHVVNVCTGKTITINHLADSLAKLMHKKISKNYEAPRAYDVKFSCGSQRKMKTYGFRTSQDIQQGLLKTIAYFQQCR